MNRKDREISDDDELTDIIKKGRFAVFSLTRDGEPYVVTLSYGYDVANRCIYIHTARSGLKLDIIRSNSRASGTVIEDHGYVRGKCTHKYRTVVFFGELEEVTDIKEKKHGMNILFKHFDEDPDSMRARFLSNDEVYDGLVVLKFRVKNIRGKKSL